MSAILPVDWPVIEETLLKVDRLPVLFKCTVSPRRTSPNRLKKIFKALPQSQANDRPSLPYYCDGTLEQGRSVFGRDLGRRHKISFDSPDRFYAALINLIRDLRHTSKEQTKVAFAIMDRPGTAANCIGRLFFAVQHITQRQVKSNDTCSIANRFPKTMGSEAGHWRRQERQATRTN